MSRLCFRAVSLCPYQFLSAPIILEGHPPPQVNPRCATCPCRQLRSRPCVRYNRMPLLLRQRESSHVVLSLADACRLSSGSECHLLSFHHCVPSLCTRNIMARVVFRHRMERVACLAGSDASVLRLLVRLAIAVERACPCLVAMLPSRFPSRWCFPVSSSGARDMVSCRTRLAVGR